MIEVIAAVVVARWFALLMALYAPEPSRKKPHLPTYAGERHVGMREYQREIVTLCRLTRVCAVASVGPCACMWGGGRCETHTGGGSRATG